MSFLDFVESKSTRIDLAPCIKNLDPHAPQDYRELAAFLVRAWRKHDMKCIGLAGGQGTGKSTLSTLLVDAGNFVGERVQILSIDDFYLTKEARAQLAREVHPLLQTRGPPGTHEIEWLIHVVNALKTGSTCTIPHFDKGTDDRDKVFELQGAVDRIVVEGWCVGATPYPDDQLTSPINALESQEDPDGSWRRYTMACLEDSYQTLNGLLDCLVYLKVPDLDTVRRWRFQQEQDRDASQRKTRSEIEEFVAHYERLTLWMLDDATKRAQVEVSLDHDHMINDARIRI